jgi:NTE family protein
MLRALFEGGIEPDLVVGTSVGAVNGAVIAASPSLEGVSRLTDVWTAIDETGIFGGSFLGRLGNLARTRTSLHSDDPLRTLLAATLGAPAIEDLPVRFQCVAASIENAREHWFTSGPLVEAVCASAAVPGLVPPAAVDGEHFYDGGIVNSIPVGRAVELGADSIYVLHVGRIERALEPPRWPWEAGLVAFEIARRHRFATDLERLPEGVDVHVLPTGAPVGQKAPDLRELRYRNFSRVPEWIESAYRASREYLDQVAAERE